MVARRATAILFKRFTATLNPYFGAFSRIEVFVLNKNARGTSELL